MQEFRYTGPQVLLELKMHNDHIPSNPDIPPNRRVSLWRIGFVCCTLLALFWAAQMYLLYAYFGPAPMPWLHALGWGMLDWYLWGAFTVLIAGLARRFPLGRGRGMTALGIHVLCATLFSGAYFILTATVWLAFKPDDGTETTWLTGFGYGVLRWLPWNILTYVAILGVVHAFEYYRVYRDREMRTTQLEARLAHAQLEALKMQLHPHFLFNTLHAISTLIHKDPEAADRMVVRLSELLRHMLDSGDAQEVPLKDELSFLRKYLEIEHVRFGDRLDIRFGVDPDTLGAVVPSLILQPLVENAIRHALAPYATQCMIEITAKRDGDMLTLAVVDSGPGIRVVDTTKLREGVGLGNTRARLRQLYGDCHQFELRGPASGGLAARIEIPFSVACDGDGGNGAG